MNKLSKLWNVVKIPKQRLVVLFVVIFALVGGFYLLNSSHAATPTIDVEAENGTLSGVATPITDGTASASKAIEFGSGVTSGQTLPFTLASTATLRASGKKVFAHYWPPDPISIDNSTPANDYYATHYLNPDYSGIFSKNPDGTTKLTFNNFGGLFRDRPLGRAPLTCPIAGISSISCTAGVSTAACPDPTVASWRLADAETEVKQAIKGGLDGFTLDVINSTYQSGYDQAVCQAPFIMMDAAHAVDPNFNIVLMPDMGGSMSTITSDQFAAWIAKLAAYPSAYHLPNGDLVVAPFYPERLHDAAWWAAWIATMKSTFGITVAFVPTFNSPTLPDITAFNSISYGFSNWGSRDPVANSATNLSANINAAHANGKIWMQPVSVQDERPSSGKYTEANNSENLRATWTAALGTTATNGADWVQIPTWNDYTEEANIAPSTHTGWSPLDISDYYLTKFKTGAFPTINKDVLYLSHRVQKAAAMPTAKTGYTQFMTLTGSSPARDDIEVLSYLTAPATVTVTIGGVAQTPYTAPAGESSHLIPLGIGTISVSAVRAGGTVASIVSPFAVQGSFAVQDEHYYYLSSARFGGIGNYDGSQ